MPRRITLDEREIVEGFSIPRVLDTLGSSAPMLLVALLADECKRRAEDEKANPVERVTFREWANVLDKLR